MFPRGGDKADLLHRDWSPAPVTELTLDSLSHPPVSSTSPLICCVAVVTSVAKAPKQFLSQLSIFSPWKLAISWLRSNSSCVIPLHLGCPLNDAFSNDKACCFLLFLSYLLKQPFPSHWNHCLACWWIFLFSGDYRQERSSSCQKSHALIFS